MPLERIGPSQAAESWDGLLLGFIEWRWAVGETFTLADLYHHEAYFAAHYPDNLDIRATLRRILRRLAANGGITSVQRGVCRR